MHAHTLVTLVILFQTLLFSLSSTQQTDPVVVRTLNACPQIPQVPFPNVRCAAPLTQCSDSSCQAGEKCCPTTPCGFSVCTNVGFSSDSTSNAQPVEAPKPRLRPIRRPLGDCPAVPTTPMMCTAVVMPPCDQSKCGNNQKCCFNGCHTVCTAVVPKPRPLVPRPVRGDCPAIPAVEGPRMCTAVFLPPCEQSKCGANEKCCFDGCHTRCTKVVSKVTVPPVAAPIQPTNPITLPVPAGACPAIPAVEGPRMCTKIFLPPCEQSNCGANEKCCFDGCHTRCTKVETQLTNPIPPPVPTGACPAIPAVDGPRMCTRMFVPPCEQSKCGANEKCCFDGCHTQCTKVGTQVTNPIPPPPRVPTGACPAIPVVDGPRICTRMFVPPCEQSKCGANEKCCSDGCHTRCTKVGTQVVPRPKPRPNPKRPSVGQCPPAPRGLMCAAVMRPPCVESSCGPNQKCCSNGCYSTCTTVTSNVASAIGIDTEAQQQQQQGQQQEQQQATETAPTWAVVLIAIGSIIIIITIVVIVQIQLVFSRRQLRY